MNILKHISHTFTALLLALSFSSVQAQDIKVVYHVNTGVDNAAAILGNVRNHLNADATAKIVVVTHGPGIDFLLEGAENMAGGKFAGPIGELASRGVEFRVCNNTLVSRKIAKEQVVLEAKIVPSGVAEVANLQAKEKYAYLRP